MFFVSGITGKVGGATARTLLEQGHQVRGLARDPARAADWTAKGVEVRQGDFTDAAAMASALEGVEGAFVMVPPYIAPEQGYPESKTVIASLTEALRLAPPPRLAVLSSIGAEKASGTGLITAAYLMEEALRDAAYPVAFVRAGSFLENFLGSMPTAEATGVLYSFYVPVDRKFQSVATKDIGQEIGGLLAKGWTGKKIVELGSPVSSNELAAAMSEVLGRPVEAQAVPRERWSGVVESFGVPAGRTWAYEEMMDGVNSGWIDFGVAGTEKVAGTTKAAEVFREARKG